MIVLCLLARRTCEKAGHVLLFLILNSALFGPNPEPRAKSHKFHFAIANPILKFLDSPPLSDILNVIWR
jgi:hypothetical protein